MTVNGTKLQRGKDIRYVLVELLLREEKGLTVSTAEKEKIEFGLLKGIQTRTVDEEETAFVLIEQSKKTTRMCNLKAFSILSIEIYDGVEREIIFFRVCDQDQEAAYEILNNTMSELKEAKRLTANETMIDPETFSDVPTDFDERAGSVKRKESLTTTNGAYRGTGCGAPGYPMYGPNSAQTGAHHTPVTTTTSYSSDGDKKPTVLKRTSKKPTKANLDKMREMVLSIAAGKFEPKPFPAIKRDEDTEEEKAAAKRRGIVTPTDDDYAAGMGVYY